MTTFEVWHAINPTFGHGPAKSFPADFVLVARVQCKTLGETFGLTNHIDHAWWDNAGVELVGAKDKRSTSVGDIVRNTTNGSLWLCDFAGWKEFIGV